jgi:Rrf2 family transcriptional regulator, iron-sulfur cluster assembly transcription factor
MLYSAASNYAIRAMTCLAAMSQEEGYVILDDLCAEAGIPRAFVAKIFQVLVRRGLLVSSKGRHGGFALARSPDKITLQEIVQAVDGPMAQPGSVAGTGPYREAQGYGLEEAWEPVRREIASFFARTTLKGRRRAAGPRAAWADHPAPADRKRRADRRELRIPA